MELFETFKRAVDRPAIHISTVEMEYHQHDTIRGEVRIVAPKSPLTGRAIVFEVWEFWMETRRTPTVFREYDERHDRYYDREGYQSETVTVGRTLESKFLAQKFRFESESVHTFPFDFRLPRNCRLSYGGSGVSIQVTIDVPKVFQPKKRHKISVFPAREFLNIIQVLEYHLGFGEYKSKRRFEYPSTYFRLMPPEPLKTRVKYLELWLMQEEDSSVRGFVSVKPKEKDILDYVQGLFNRNLWREPFCLDRSTLCMPDGKANTRALIDFFGSLLW